MKKFVLIFHLWICNGRFAGKIMYISAFVVDRVVDIGGKPYKLILHHNLLDPSCYEGKVVIPLFDYFILYHWLISCANMCVCLLSGQLHIIGKTKFSDLLSVM